MTEEEVKQLVGTSIVRKNMMEDPNYSGYCANPISRNAPGGCYNPRTIFTGLQFWCPSCGWMSDFPEDFIKAYKQHHGL